MTLSNQALPVCRYGWEYGWRGGVASTALLAERMVVLWRRMRELPIEEHDGVKVALVDDNMPAFSFGCRIVVGTVSYATRQLAPMNIHEPTFRTDLGVSSDLLDCRLSLYLNLKDVFGSVGERPPTPTTKAAVSAPPIRSTSPSASPCVSARWSSNSKPAPATVATDIYDLLDTKKNSH